jgi:hypothetical protein
VCGIAKGWVAAGVFGTVLMVAPASARAQAQSQAGSEVPVAMNRVPEAVLAAAGKAAPGVKLTKAVKAVEEGEIYYDLIGHDAQGREVDVELNARGQVLGVGVEIPFSAVPRPVIAALRAKTRGMKFTDAEAVTLNGRLIAYRFGGQTADGDDVEATVSPDGRNVEVVVDDE